MDSSSLAHISDWLKSPNVPNLHIVCTQWIPCEAGKPPQTFITPSPNGISLLVLEDLCLGSGACIPYDELLVLLYMTNPDKLTVECARDEDTSPLGQETPTENLEEVDVNMHSKELNATSDVIKEIRQTPVRPRLSSLHIGYCTDLHKLLTVIQCAMPELDWSSIQRLHVPYLGRGYIPIQLSDDVFKLSPEELSLGLDLDLMSDPNANVQILASEKETGSPEYFAIIIREVISTHRSTGKSNPHLMDHHINHIINNLVDVRTVRTFCFEFDSSIDLTKMPNSLESIKRFIAGSFEPSMQSHIIINTRSSSSISTQLEHINLNQFTPITDDLRPYKLEELGDVVKLYKYKQQDILLWFNLNRSDENYHAWIHSYAETSCADNTRGTIYEEHNHCEVGEGTENEGVEVREGEGTGSAEDVANGEPQSQVSPCHFPSEDGEPNEPEVTSRVKASQLPARFTPGDAHGWAPFHCRFDYPEIRCPRDLEKLVESLRRHSTDFTIPRVKITGDWSLTPMSLISISLSVESMDLNVFNAYALQLSDVDLMLLLDILQPQTIEMCKTIITQSDSTTINRITHKRAEVVLKDVEISWSSLAMLLKKATPDMISATGLNIRNGKSDTKDNEQTVHTGSQSHLQVLDSDIREYALNCPNLRSLKVYCPGREVFDAFYIIAIYSLQTLQDLSMVLSFKESKEWKIDGEEFCHATPCEDCFVHREPLKVELWINDSGSDSDLVAAFIAQLLSHLHRSKQDNIKLRFSIKLIGPSGAKTSQEMVDGIKQYVSEKGVVLADEQQTIAVVEHCVS